MLYLEFMKRVFLIIIILISACSNSVKDSAQAYEIVVEDYNIYCDTTDFQSLYTDYRSNSYIPITIEHDSIEQIASMRIRGDSSRDYDKKSLKIKIPDSIYINKKSVFNFNAEYSDKSFLRTFLSTMIFKKLNYPCFSASFANLNINNNYHGLFLEIENMDRDFLRINGLNPNGDLFKATKDGACLYALNELDSKWEKKTNKKSSMISLERLIHDISQTPVEDFYDYVQQHFNYPMLIDFLAINAFIANGSTYYHNYYLYRDQENDGKWILFPWDLDKTISYYDWKPYKYHYTSSDWENDNALIEKCILNETIFNDFKKRIVFIGDIISADFYNPLFQTAIENLQQYVIRDSTNQIPSDKEWRKMISQEKKFLKNRSAKLINQIESAPLSFKVHQTHDELSIPFKISWDQSNNAEHYELWISNHFLFPDSSTYKFDTADNFHWIKEQLPIDRYYWKVIAKNNFSYTEGFNSKNTFMLKQGMTLPDIINQDMQLIKANSPYRVSQDITIDTSSVLIIEPGVTILMEENTEIVCHGSFQALGSEEQPISIVPLSSDSYFNSLYFFNSEDISFNYVIIKDGVVNSKFSNLKLKNSNIIINNRPMQIKDKRPSIIWAWHGHVDLDNIYLKGNGKGEGVNINYAHSNIINSKFYYTPDAIELINVEKGAVVNNTVMFSPDDAIDLNDCMNIQITDNTLVYNSDKGISIGTDWNNKFVSSKPGFNRKSLEIEISDNYILGNNIGISVKDSSFVTANNNIISFNKIGVQLYKKYENYLLGGILEADQNIISANTSNFFIDSFSKIQGSNKRDSIYILPTNNSFFIPSLLTYEIVNDVMILYNNSNIDFELADLVLLNQDNLEIFKFDHNHIINPKKNLKIGSIKDRKEKNYFYDSKLNLFNSQAFYIKDKSGNIVLLKHK